MVKDTYRYKKYGAFRLIRGMHPIEGSDVAPAAVAGGDAR